MIEIAGLSHAINGQPILRDISTRIPKGKVTALIGPNGAGKSTLLNLIGRLLPLQSGRVSVDGLDVTGAGEGLARVLAILAQKNSVSSRLRVRELVAFGRWPHRHARDSAADRAAVEEALVTFGLESLGGRFLDELSGGQQQRAYLAMTFAQATDWLLLDEPLNNLDMSHARALMAKLHALCQMGKSVVIVVHEVNYAAGWADHVIALRDGTIAAEGAPEDVLRPEVLGRVYDMDLRVVEVEGRRFVLHHI